MSKASEALKRQKQLAAKRTPSDKSAVRPVTPTPLADQLQKPEAEFGHRVNLYVSDDQDARIRRLAFEHRMSLVEVVRRLMDAAPDEAVRS